MDPSHTTLGPLRTMREALRKGNEDALKNPLEYVEWLPHQWAFLHDLALEKLLRTGNQLGKTYAGAAEVIWACLGEHPFNPGLPPPPVEWWVICSSFSQSIAVQGKFWELIPQWRVVSQPYEPKNGFGAKNPMVMLDNGSIIRFKTENQDTKDLASATIHGAMFDEPPGNERTYTEIQKRVQEMDGRIIITMTPVNARVDWIKLRTEQVDDEGDPLLSDHHYKFEPANFIPVGSDRPLRLAKGKGAPKDAAWCKRTRARTIKVQRSVTLDGEWETTVEGSAFQDSFRPMWQELPPGDWKVRVGCDHGSGRNFSEVGVIGFVRGPRGKEEVYIRAEYVSETTTTTQDDAAGMLDMCKAAGVRWAQVDTAIGDKEHHGGKHGRDRKHNDELLAAMRREEGRRTGARINPRDYRPIIRSAKSMGAQRGALSRDVQWLHECMVGGRFFVHPSCTRLIESLQRWAYEKRKDSTKISRASAASDWKHSIDATRYMLRAEMSDVRPVVVGLVNG